MTTSFIATVSGITSPNILIELAQTTREYKAHWQTSNVIKLDGQFSALLKITLDTENQKPLQHAFKQEFPELNFIYSPTQNVPNLNTKSVSLNIECNDRAGLTKDINTLLNNLQINIEHQVSYRIAVPSIGDTVYSAQFELRIPQTISTADIKQQLEGIKQNMRVEISTNPS